MRGFCLKSWNIACFQQTKHCIEIWSFVSHQRNKKLTRDPVGHYPTVHIWTIHLGINGSNVFVNPVVPTGMIASALQGFSFHEKQVHTERNIWIHKEAITL